MKSQFDPGQAAGGQRPPERQPAGAVLAGGDVDAEYFASALGVDPGGDQSMHVDHPAALADLEDQGVSSDEGVRAAVQRPAAEGLHRGVEFFGHHRHLPLGQTGDAQRLDQAVHPPGGHPEQVAGGHHRGQGPLGTLAAFQQPSTSVSGKAGTGHH